MSEVGGRKASKGMLGLRIMVSPSTQLCGRSALHAKRKGLESRSGKEDLSRIEYLAGAYSLTQSIQHVVPPV